MLHRNQPSKTIELVQSYPNPFTSKIPTPYLANENTNPQSDIKITDFDILGSEVKDSIPSRKIREYKRFLPTMEFQLRKEFTFADWSEEMKLW